MAVKRKRLAQRRKALGYTQESLAERLRVDRTTVVRWERAECEPQPWFRRRLAGALDVSLDQLDELLSDITVTATLDTASSTAVTVRTEFDDGGDTMDRRTFTINTALAGLGVASPLRGLLTSADLPATLGMEQLRLVTGVIDRFEQADAATGGDAFCDVAIALHERLARWERECSYSREVGEGLQVALGELESWIGWLALDAERGPESRRYLHEAIVRARFSDNPQLEVRAMTYLSLLIRDSRPRESLQCAEAAQRISAGWATPRLATLLHLRAARAHAAMRDAIGFGREMAKAKSQLDRGTNDDDPLYIQFVTPLELTGIEGLSQLALNRPDRAAAAFTQIMQNADPVYRRNLGYYSSQLAEALRQQGDIIGASDVALGALPAVTKLHSSRTSRLFAGLRAGLGTHSSRVLRARDFAEAYDEAVAR